MAFSGSGAGTDISPYEITNWQQLAEIGSDLSATYMLMNDLGSGTSDYGSYAGSSANSGAGWDALGNSTTGFSGSFEGSGSNIDDLYINRNTTDYVGLFGYLDSNATIKNVNMLNADVTDSSGRAGILTGLTNGVSGVTISNVSVVGSMDIGSNGRSGAIAAWFEPSGYGNISDCDASIYMSCSFARYVGLFAGRFAGVGSITNCNVYDSYGSFDGTQWAGGFIGRADNFTNTHISNSYAKNITIKSTNFSTTGGFFGRVDDTNATNSSDIRNCYVVGSLIRSDNTFGMDNVGGFSGVIQISNQPGSLENCYSDMYMDTFGENNFGFFVGYLFDSGNNLNINNTYAAGSTFSGSATYYFDQGNVIWGTHITNSFYDSDKSGLTDPSSDSDKTTTEMQDIDTFTNTSTSGLTTAWDMVTINNHDGDKSTAIWFIDETNDYPRLWYQYDDFSVESFVSYGDWF